ncbi:N-acetylmuramoyl-L-alanine amidase [Bacillus sp. SA1-12]|uniref:N-acetylmuramoyl-L-alanine amidase n=1 Tax=Bacillus sp. SA1-12 TaxID=1455638 RepID=UPI000B06E594|nr:N-acetylmuramoyl-L-alanine amidase [Bacillus sp. SA1-12]
MVKIYLDPGHGGTDPGAQGNGLREKEITLDIALKIRTILLNRYQNVEVRMSRTSDTSVSLAQRTSDANSWGADFFLSIHCNAFNGSAGGYEDYIHNSLQNTSTAAAYQDVIHAEAVKVNQLQDRGQKKANFYVLRETAMPALLTENGFIDNSHDAALMKDHAWRQKAAQGHVNGLAKAFNLKPKQTENPETVYKIVAGSFQSRENAEERFAYLRSKGIESFVDTVTISDATWYRVQAGAFSNRENAEQRLTKVKNAGIQDAYIVTEGGGANQVTGYTVMGDIALSAEQMNQFAKSINPNALELAHFYAKYGEVYGIRGDLAFAQALHETNFFRFTGVVKAGQNNFCGLGATGPEQPGASFASQSDGVLAHIQHLFAYATTNSLPNEYPLVDPRFNVVKRGIAPTWIALNGKWAVPGTNYGQLILEVYKKMVNYTIQQLEGIIEEI